MHRVLGLAGPVSTSTTALTLTAISTILSRLLPLLALLAACCSIFTALCNILEHIGSIPPVVPSPPHDFRGLSRPGRVKWKWKVLQKKVHGSLPLWSFGSCLPTLSTQQLNTGAAQIEDPSVPQPRLSRPPFHLSSFFILRPLSLHRCFQFPIGLFLVSRFRSHSALLAFSRSSSSSLYPSFISNLKLLDLQTTRHQASRPAAAVFVLCPRFIVHCLLSIVCLHPMLSFPSLALAAL